MGRHCPQDPAKKCGAPMGPPSRRSQGCKVGGPPGATPVLGGSLGAPQPLEGPLTAPLPLVGPMEVPPPRGEPRGDHRTWNGSGAATALAEPLGVPPPLAGRPQPLEYSLGIPQSHGRTPGSTHGGPTALGKAPKGATEPGRAPGDTTAPGMGSGGPQP
ncbi:basic salivary proline-rich protein 1-like [Homarus americanus]|uniref:basic salivary proline-rich protein 1-like n=1 Tax=Homarus americanus TaxID=6706 RepID=UPI001C439CEA|nr:basic salivary proline-rich protein 1-like [Homarus americanus]